MKKLFQMIPSGFFNCLSSGSSSGVYSDCLQIIYDQYDREISDLPKPYPGFTGGLPAGKSCGLCRRG